MPTQSTKLTLISTDVELAALCREVLRAFPGSQWEFNLTSCTMPSCDSDIYLWDYTPETDTSTFVRSCAGQQHFYLVSPELLDIFRASRAASRGAILLKPITQAVLAAFIGSAAAARSQRQIEELRADRNEVLECLLQANFRLQEYDQCRTNFLARAVHDFRAPLTALQGFCGMLSQERFGPINEEQLDVLRRMLRSTQRLSRMASSMSQLTIQNHVHYEAQLQLGDIRECVEQAVYECRPLAAEKSIVLSIEDLRAPAGPLYFDSSQIEELLTNLLDNAHKFTPNRGRIAVSGYPYFWDRRFLQNGYHGPERRTRTQASPNGYRVDVKDTGVGIPAEYLESIFEEYTRYSGSQDRSGGGLGLAICKLIAKRHGGDIWAQTYDSGTTFSVVIPYGCNRPADA